MSDLEKTTISPDLYRVLKTPALVGPKDEISYHDQAVQQVITEIFGYLLPKVSEKGGQKFFYCDNGEGGNLCEIAVEATDIKQIPRKELAKLLGGWFAIRRLGTDSRLDVRIKAILSNFRLPNPATALDQYRISTDSSGESRLHVWWGIENIERKKPLLDATAAFAVLLGCEGSEIDKRWQEYRRSTTKQLVMPGNATSPITIDPITKAVRVLSRTGAVPIKPIESPENASPELGGKLVQSKAVGKLSKVNPYLLMAVILIVGILILLLVIG